ncbi:hypothetical protein SCLCIDRAFT_1208059 [Scleroderma citrinum Foug A]|uniref:Uncharacterized protein n=1 Tax=Scleroderma citrinum Foug A TaxID=1036808 RepID=A0A0C3EA69_9AGAM|nr:hypothetical protein SCLCIDRAFT_1208059 [Scleroderma citrinum Foug A]
MVRRPPHRPTHTSRCRDTIRLLRRPDKRLFTPHPSEHLRKEDERLDLLDRKTKLRWESPSDPPPGQMSQSVTPIKSVKYLDPLVNLPLQTAEVIVVRV